MKPTRSLDKAKAVNIEKQSCSHPLDASFHFICILIKRILQICILHACKAVAWAANQWMPCCRGCWLVYTNDAQIKSFCLHLSPPISHICMLCIKPLRELLTDGFVRNCWLVFMPLNRWWACGKFPNGLYHEQSGKFPTWVARGRRELNNLAFPWAHTHSRQCC